jgi:hypothetical protein
LLIVLVKPAQIILQQTFPSQSHNEAVVAPGSAGRKSQELFVVSVSAPAIAALQKFEAFGSGMISCFFLKASHRASGAHGASFSVRKFSRTSGHLRPLVGRSRSRKLVARILQASRCSSGGQHLGPRSSGRVARSTR